MRNILGVLTGGAICQFGFMALAAGYVTMKIARQWRAVQILAGLIIAYAFVVHMILHWARFPWWYNLAVVLLMGPALLLGSRFAGRLT